MPSRELDEAELLRLEALYWPHGDTVHFNPSVFPPGSTHSTFSANPMGTAVALETMRMLAEHDYETMVMEKGAYLLDGLRDLKRRHRIVGEVDGLGLALRMEICEPHDSYTPSKAIADRMVEEGLAGGIEVNGRRYGLVFGYWRLLQECDNTCAQSAHN